MGLALVVDAELFRLDSVIRWLDTRRRPAQARRRGPADRSAAAARCRGPAAPGARDAAGSAAAPEARDTGDGPAMSMLELRDVSKIYGEGPREVHALREVSLTVDAGAHGGGDGAERLGQEHAADDRGQPGGARPAARCWSAAPRWPAMSRNDRARLRRRTIGYVFQDFNLLAGLTAAENVALPLELDGLAARTARAAGLEALERARPGRAGGPVPRRAVRRRAAAGGDRPRGGRRAAPAAGRRAVRRAGLGATARRSCGCCTARASGAWPRWW